MHKHYMGKERYCKKINAKPDKIYIEVDRETGESLEVTPKKVFSKEFITHKKKFMIVFSENIQTSIFKVIGEYYKYIGVLLDCTGYDNSLNIVRFRKSIGITQSAFSRLQKKLSDFGVICYDDGEYYLNPIIGVKSDKIEVKLWELFKSKNKELYNVTEL